VKNAKKIVLRMHPDKSHLSPEYFLFYKKAFSIVVDFFNNYHKTTKEVPVVSNEKMKYSVEQEYHPAMVNKLGEMKPSAMNEKFNELYEKNMTKPVDETRNKWFMSNDPMYEYDSPSNAKDIAGKMENIKSKQSALVQYQGVQHLNSFSGPSSRYFDEIDEDPNQYVDCDPFSKLKYEDLRKVHRDQTVFSVSENDYQKMNKYSSVDQYHQARNQQDLKPFSEMDANQILLQREEALKKEMADKLYTASIKRKEYEAKNNAIRSTFMLLENEGGGQGGRNFL
jgi:hypothetical protein